MPSAEYELWWEQFSRTGNISPIALGMAKERLAELFGAPDDYSSGRSLTRAPIRKYGSLEFHFDDSGLLNLIFMDTADAVVVSIRQLAR